MSPRACATTAIAIAAQFILGCRGTVRLSDQARGSLRSVSVEASVVETVEGTIDLPVDVPTKGASFYAPWFIMPVGATIDLISWKENRRLRATAFQSRLKQAAVDVPAIVRSEFQSGLKQRGSFVVVEKEGDAQFHLEIEHALVDPWGLRGTWKPRLRVTGTLLDRQGNVLWRCTAKLSDDDRRLPEVGGPFFSHTDSTRSTYRTAARLAVSELIASLQR